MWFFKLQWRSSGPMRVLISLRSWLVNMLIYFSNYLMRLSTDMNNHYADQRRVFLAPLEICIFFFSFFFFFFHFVQKLNNKFYYSFKRFTNSMSSFRLPQFKTFTRSERQPTFDIRSESIEKLSKFQFLVDKKLVPE